MSDTTTPTGLGRRIQQRRQALGLTWADIAERTGLSQRRAERIETHPFALSGLELIRLARALDLTVSELVGPNRPVPSTPPLVPELTPMRRPECLELLRAGQVGRIAYTGADGLVVFPVNYRLVDDVIVIRTTTDSPIAQYELAPVAFELDFIDEGLHDGWSVLVNGTVRPAEDAERDAALASLEAWAGGTRDAVVVIEIERVAGRRIRSY